MSGRVFIAVGVVLALAGLGVYFTILGLDKADKFASVVSAFVALAGLGLSVYGMTRRRRNPPLPAEHATETNTQTNIARGNATLYVVMDGTMDIHTDGSGDSRTTLND